MCSMEDRDESNWWKWGLALGGLYLGEKYVAHRVEEAYSEATADEFSTPGWMVVRIITAVASFFYMFGHYRGWAWSTLQPENYFGFGECLLIGLISGVVGAIFAPLIVGMLVIYLLLKVACAMECFGS